MPCAVNHSKVRAPQRCVGIGEQLCQQYRPLSSTACAHARPPPSLLSRRACSRTTAVALPDGQPYDIGQPASVVNIWLDPKAGADTASGESEQQALRSFTAAWDRASGPELAAATPRLCLCLPPAIAPAGYPPPCSRRHRLRCPLPKQLRITGLLSLLAA